MHAKWLDEEHPMPFLLIGSGFVLDLVAVVIKHELTGFPVGLVVNRMAFRAIEDMHVHHATLPVVLT